MQYSEFLKQYIGKKGALIHSQTHIDTVLIKFGLDEKTMQGQVTCELMNIGNDYVTISTKAAASHKNPQNNRMIVIPLTMLRIEVV